MNYLVVSIFGIYVKFLDLLFLDKFTTVSLILLLLLLTTSLLLALNAFKVKFDNFVVFNKKISNIAILFKPKMKC